MPLGGEASNRKEKLCRRNKSMTPLFGGMKEERVSLLFFQAMKNIKEDLKEMKGEECRRFMRGFEAIPRYSHDGCEHSSTHAEPQHSLLPTFTTRRMEEEYAPREETLSDYLQEYESQSWRFKEHLEFQEFLKLKEERSNSHKRSKRVRSFLSHFDGSAECPTKAWVEELDSYF